MSIYDLFADLSAEATRPELAWMDSAACAGVGGDLHYPEKGQNVTAAKRVCLGCEVRGACLEYALERNEIWGIWGGLSERQRHAIRRQRQGKAAA